MSVPARPPAAPTGRAVGLVPQVDAVLVMAVGVVVLTGWTLRPKIGPSLPAMTPNTAVALVLAGIALWLLAPGASGWRRPVGLGLALLVALFGAVVLAEYATGWRPGLDLWLFHSEVAAAARFPGRPSPHTAIAFVLAGLALGLLDADRRGGYRPWLLLVPLSAAVALVGLLGDVYQAGYLYRASTGTGMAPHTAVAFLLLNTGLLACRPERQPTRTFLAPGPAGLLARRLVPALLLAPLCVGGLLLLGQRDRLWGPAFGTALATVVMLAALTVVVVTVRDVERLDQRRRAVQKELLEAERRLRELTDAATDAIVSADADGRVCSWNRGAEAMFGCRAEEVVGEPLTVLIPERLRAGYETALERARQTGRSELVGGVTELVGLRRDGSEFPVEVSLGMWESSQGTRFSGVIRDITDRKHAEAALQQVKLAAEQANQAKSEYLSRMSHELRTPLNAILGFAQLLELDEPHQEQRDSIHHILAGAQHLLGLINEDLDIAAIEAGRLRLSLEPVAVAEVAAETVSLIRPLADHRSIQLEAPALGCQDHILADRQRFKQILLNLLSNAVKHNRQGGSVQFACGYTAGQRLRISVTDTGPGIAPEQLDLLFVPFERLGSERTSAEGSGLGLPVSKRLAQAMGGTLEVTTALGRGSTFWVEVPLAKSAERQPATKPEPHQEQASPAGPELTVLYIEDNLSSLQLIERIVSCWPGIRLISATAPQRGLDLAGEHRPDLVLLDLHLPDIPGEEVLRRLRASPETADIPVVILTADATPGLTERLLDRGARALLTKPLDVKQVLTLLDTIASEQPTAAPSPSSQLPTLQPADLAADLDPPGRRSQ